MVQCQSMNKEYVVFRKGCKEDFDKANVLVEEFVDEYLNLYGFIYNKEQLYQSMELMVDNSFIAIVDDNIVGVIAGCIQNSLVDGSKLFQETIWYVSKEHRRVGIKLFDYCLDELKKDNVSKVIFGSIGLNSKVGEFLKHKNFSQLETHFIRNL